MSKHDDPKEPQTAESWVDDLFNRFVSIAAHTPAFDWKHDVILGCGFTYFAADMDAAEAIGIGYLTNEERTRAAVPLLWMVLNSGARLYGLTRQQTAALCQEDFLEFEDALRAAYVSPDREAAILSLTEDDTRWLMRHPEFAEDCAEEGDA